MSLNRCKEHSRSPRRPALALLAIVPLLAGCAAYTAAPLDPGASQAAYAARTLGDGTQGPWTLDRLAGYALAHHPDMEVARAHIAAVVAAQTTAGEMPNPTVSFAPSYATKAAGSNPWTIGWSFDVPIETAHKRELRIAAARKDSEVARIEYAQAAWRVRSHVRDAFAEVLLDGRAADLLSREVEDRQRYVDLLESRLRAGEAARPEVDTARVDLLTARQAWRAAQGQLEDARARLAATLGLPVRGLEGAALDWPGIDTFPALTPAQHEALRTAGLLNRLDLHRELAAYESADASLRLELARQYPDLHLGPGYTFDQGQNKWELGATIELPLLNQNAGGIAEAQARRREQGARVLAVQAMALGELESAEARYAAALRELADAQEQVQAAGRQLEFTQRALEAGEEDRLAVTGQQVQRDVAERMRFDAVRKAREAAGVLEDAIERPLETLGAAPATAPAATTQPSPAPPATSGV